MTPISDFRTYRQWVTILGPVPTGRADAYGQPNGGRPTVGTFKAKVSQTTAREAPNATRMKAVATIDVEMRWLGGLIARPTALHQIVYEGRTFSVESVTNPDELNIALKLTCKEVTNPA